MVELDIESLRALHESVSQQVRRMDWMRRMRPVQDLMIGRARSLTITTIPEIMANPMAQQVDSYVNLKSLLETSLERRREHEAELQSALDSARRRTAALRSWLESLS